MFKIELSDGRHFEVEAANREAARIKACRIERAAAVVDVIPV